MTLEAAYLGYILTSLKTNDPDVGLRKTLINSWNAHRRGGDWLNRNGKPRWLSNKDTRRFLKDQFDFVSRDARDLADLGKFTDLVIDHAIPLAVICRNMDESYSCKEIHDICSLREFLVKWFKLGLITTAEHDEKLNRWKSKMPDQWCPREFSRCQGDALARYGPLGADLSPCSQTYERQRQEMRDGN